MRRLIFLTGEDLLDVDLPIVKEIHSEFDFTWIVVLKGYGWFLENDLRELCRQHHIDLIVLHQDFKLKNPKTLFFHFSVLCLMKKMNADIIYDSYLGVPYMHFFTRLWLDRSKFVVAIHDVIQHHGMKNGGVRSFYYDFLMKGYKNIHLFSENQLKLFKQRFPYTEKNILLAPLVLKSFGDYYNTSSKNEVFTFLFFGLIRENKGLDILIKAVNSLGQKRQDFKVIIAGKAADTSWDNYKNLIEQDHLFELKIRTLEDHEVNQLMTESHFLVLPYRDVTQSGVLLTSYYYRLPAIATNLEGFQEYIVNDKTGFLFDLDSPEALAQKMANALDLSSKEYSELTDSLERFISREISLKSVSEKYIQYLKNLN